MTVAELIGLLGKFPGDMPVAVRTVDGDTGETEIEYPSAPCIRELVEVNIGTAARPFFCLTEECEISRRWFQVKSRSNVHCVLIWDGANCAPRSGCSVLEKSSDGMDNP